MTELGHRLQGRIGSKSSNVRCAAESGSNFRALALAAVEPVKSLVLDALTVVDDINYFDALDAIPHLPAFLRGANGLRKFYRASRAQ